MLLGGKSPHRVHQVFVLSKSDLGSQVLFWIFYSFLNVPWCLGQTCFSALRVPALILPLLILSKSYSIPYFGRRIGIIFLGSSLSVQTNFCFYCKHFLRCLKGLCPFLSAKTELTFCSGSCLSKTSSLSCSINYPLSVLLPVASFMRSSFLSNGFQLCLPTIQFLLLFQTSWNRSLCISEVTMFFTI